jgi:stress-induced morphogen
MITPNEVMTKLESAFPDAKIEVFDLTGGMDHYKVSIKWGGFQSLTPVARHRLVHSALKEELRGGAIHALTLELSE